jgi:hypothetical protein
MDEQTIRNILSKDKYTKDIFVNVFARDELPNKIKYPSCIVLNTKPRNHSGEHWLCIYYDEHGIAYFFDSYGKHPSYFNLESYLDNTSIRYIYNTRKIQGKSSYCGYYCLLFLLLKSRNELAKFFAYFNENTDINDKKVKYLIEISKN